MNATTPAPSHELLPVAHARDTAALAWRLGRGRGRALALTALSYLLAGFAGIVPVWMIGQVIDAVSRDAQAAVIYRAAAVMAVSALLAAAFSALSSAALAAAVAPALAELREDVLDRALHLDAATLEAAGIGDVVSRVGDDVRELTRSLDEAVPLLLNSIVAIAFTAAGLFALDWRLGLAGLGALPFYVYALRWYLPRSAPLYRTQRLVTGERAEAVVTGIQGERTLRAFGREDEALRRVEETSRSAVEVTVSVFVMYTRFGARMNGSELAGLVLVLGTGFALVHGGLATVGAATAAALFFHRLFNPIGALLFVFDSVQSSGAALARLAGVALLPVPPATATPTGPDPALVLAGVSHAYEPGHPVLRDVDLVLAPGEHVAVVGATGAGKSTLGGIAAGTVHPTEGSVRLGGLDIVNSDEAGVRRHVALVSQEVHVFAGTVRDNLVLARADATDAQLWDALRRTGAEPWVRALPDALDTVVGGHGHELTPARAQQLALARVLLLDPEVVVLDEATAEAGSSGARDLELAARAVLEGRTALVVAHRLTQARTADRVVVMHDGQVVEQGSHAELVAAGGRYAALWSAWSR
jgi:ABC-type multidrug transport system fused ATPase/permease subunit